MASLKSTFAFVAALCLVFLPAFTRCAYAQGVLSYGVGGSWVPLGAAPKAVRLLEQDVRVQLPERKVEVRSVFYNEGAATKLTMAFPETGTLGETDYRLPALGYLRQLKCELDGRPFALKQLKTGFIAPDEGGGDYRELWGAPVAFGAQQTRLLRVTYRGGASSEMLNAPEAGSRQHFAFDFSLGAGWKGKVTRSHIEFDTRGLQSASEIKFTASGWERLGQSFAWEARASEPKASVEVSWFPGVRAFEVDGAPPLERCVVVGKTQTLGEWQAVYPRKIGGKLWVPMRLLQQWLPAAPDGFRNGIVQAAIPTYIGLNYGALNVNATIGARDLELWQDGKVLGHRTMSAPAFIERGATLIELLPVVQALGGRVTTRGGVVQLWFKREPR